MQARSPINQLDGPVLRPANGAPPRRLIVLLHGYGSDGHDLMGLAPHWAPLFPDAMFLAPNALEPCEIGFGYQWFGLEDRSPAKLIAGVQTAAPILNAWLDSKLSETGIAPSGLALVGFSQGTMVALHAGLRRPVAPGAVIGFSGALIAGERLPAEIKSKPPVLLIHGAADQVVPPGALSVAVKGLEAAGVKVASLLRSGLGHGIDPEGMREGALFLRNWLEPRPPAPG